MSRGFFWIWCATWWLITIFVLRKRQFQQLILSHQIPEQKIRTFQQRFSAALVTPCVVLQLCEWLGGFSFPDGYGRSALYTNRWMQVAWVVVLLYWFAVVYWVWIRPGADYLAHFAPVFNLPSNPKKIRCFTLCLIILSALSSIVLFVTH